MVIADDHILFRDTLITYLGAARPHIKTLAAANFQELFALLKQNKDTINYMLVDYAMPGMISREAFLNLVREYRSIPLIIMSGVAEHEDIGFIRKIGARGYIPKTMSGKAMMETLDLILSGKEFFPAAPDSRLFARQQNVPDTYFTTRECDVLDLLSTGVSNEEIGKKLDLKLATVKLHVKNILRKLNFKNRTQAALWARGGRTKLSDQ